MTTVCVGDRELEMGGDDLVELRDSSDHRDNMEMLHERLMKDGCLFIRNFHDKEFVREAREEVLSHLASENLLDLSEPVEDAVVHPDWESEEFDISSSSWAHYTTLEELIEGDDIMEFFRRFFGARPFVLDRKRGRAKATGYFTGFHVDRIFMGRGTEKLYTVWRPIGDCPVEMGPLILCPEFHRYERLRETYGQLDVDIDRVMPFFSNDLYDVVETIRGPLATADFEAGDVLSSTRTCYTGRLSTRRIDSGSALTPGISRLRNPPMPGGWAQSQQASTISATGTTTS
jgi:hypothetical protein